MKPFYFIGTEKRVLDLLADNPTLPYSTIAKDLGVTRERVRQIARKNGFPPRKRILKPKMCPVCGKTFYARSLYCSSICVRKASRKRRIVMCFQCGKLIERTPGNLRNHSGRYFCNRDCYGKWAGVYILPNFRNGNSKSKVSKDSN